MRGTDLVSCLGRLVMAGRGVWLVGLVVGLAGCSGGGDSGSLTPAGQTGAAAPGATPAGGSAALAEEATRNLVGLYREAVLQEDSDGLQGLLAEGGGAFQGSTFLEAMVGLFQRAAVTGLELTAVGLEGEAGPAAVTFQEALSVLDPVGLEQRTQAGRTRWQLGRRAEAGGGESILIAQVAREGPQVEVVMRGRVVAGRPVRVAVRETTGSFAIAGGAVGVPETGEEGALTLAAGGAWQAVVTAPGGPEPQPLRVHLRGAGGEGLEVRHRYRLRVPGEGVGQVVAGTEGLPLRAVAGATDGSVWAGGEGGAVLVRVAPGAGAATVEARLLADLDGQVEDLVIDQLGRLHALVLAPNAAGDVVLDPADPDLFCQTVNVFNPAYPLRLPDGQASAGTRAVAAGGGDIWLFGSDGGVARVADAFRGGVCPAEGVGVRYDPIFRRGETGLLTNTVPAFQVGADGALWFGTAVGLVRLAGGQFTPALFDPGLSVGGEVATLEAFFREVAEALFAARPLTTVRVGEVSLEEQFGRPLVKADLVFSLAEDRQGRLWVGTLGGGLRRVEVVDGVPRDTLHLTRHPARQEGLDGDLLFAPEEGLSSNLIFALTVGPDGSVWAATEEGVSRVQDTPGGLARTSFSALDGLPTPVWDVAVAPNGAVWLATAGGLVRLVAGGGLRGVVVDTQGRPVAGAEVAVAGTAFRAVTDAQGQYVLEDLPPGPVTLEVESSFVAGGPFDSVVREVEVVAGEQTLPPLVVPPAGALQLVRVSGEGQMGVVGRALPQSLVVAVRDGLGQPEAGIAVTFRVTQGQGTVAPATIATGADGQAGTMLTLGPAAGPLTVQAEGAGLAPVVFSATAGADRDTAQLVIVSGDRQVGVPGEVLPAPLVVQLADQFGNPVAGEPVTGTVVQGDSFLLPPTPTSAGTSSAPPQQASGGPSVTVATDAQGQAAFQLQAGVGGEAIVTEVFAPQLSQANPVQFLTVVGLALPVGIAVEVDGRLAVVDRALDAVVRVDPVSGARTIVSDATTGGGPHLISPLDIAVEAAGTLVVVDDLLGAVVRVDPVSGARTIVSGCAERNDERVCIGGVIGSGPPLGLLRGITVEAAGALVVADSSLGAVVRVDPVSGARTIVSGCAGRNEVGVCIGGVIGSGPGLGDLLSIAVEAAGTLVGADFSRTAVVRVDPVSGARTIVSGCIHGGFSGCIGGIIGSGPPLQLPESIAVEAAGTLVVADSSLGAVVRVDPVSGARTIVSGCAGRNEVGVCIGGVIGDGPPFGALQAIAVEAAGTLVVTDALLGAVVRVDPISGARAIIAQGATGRGSGPPLAIPVAIAVEAAGALVVADSSLGAVVRVDPVSGARTIVSGCAGRNEVGVCIGGVIGDGPPFGALQAIAVEADSSLVVGDSGLEAVVRVDPGTGDRTIVSSAITGNGPPVTRPLAIAVEANGSLVVTEGSRDAVVRVDPGTGDRTIVSDATTGNGPLLRGLVAVAVEAAGTLVVVDDLLGAVVRVDPGTGDRTIVSDATTGGGPDLASPQAIAVEADGQLVVADNLPGAVVRVDPGTGDRTIVSSAITGNGPPVTRPLAIAVEADGQLVVVERSLQAVVRVDPGTGDRTLVSR